MRLKSTLVCLENTLGLQDLATHIVLSEGTGHWESADTANPDRNFVIAYNGSTNSQMALDLTLWIAYQTRLISQQKVFVHVVYAIDRRQESTVLEQPHDSFKRSSLHNTLLAKTGLPIISLGRRKTDLPNTLLHPVDTCLKLCDSAPPTATQALLNHADCVLWQARCLAEEWRGSLEAHLRFGNEVEELQRVVAEVQADLLVLGCHSADHPVARTLIAQVPCPILGIPTGMEALV